MYSKTVRLPRDWLVPSATGWQSIRWDNDCKARHSWPKGIRIYLLQLEEHMQCRWVYTHLLFFEYRISAIGPCDYYLFTARFCVGTIWSRLVFEGGVLSLKAHRHQRCVNKVYMGGTVTTVRCCQKYVQPLSSAVSQGNQSYNMSSHSASLVTIFSHYLYVYVCLCRIY